MNHVLYVTVALTVVGIGVGALLLEPNKGRATVWSIGVAAVLVANVVILLVARAVEHT